jgi:hypothetical protein
MGFCDPRRCWIGLVALLCAPAALAQTLWGPLQPGMTEQALKAALPQVVKLKRPLNLPNGVRGLWHLPDTPWAGASFDSVFYFRSGRLWEVAQTLSVEQANCDVSPTFGTVLSSLQASYGPPRTAQDGDAPGGATETDYWSQDGIDIAAMQSRAPNRCLIRVSYKPQLLLDASQL